MSYFNVMNTKLNAAKAAYESIYGHKIPIDVLEANEPDWLFYKLDKAIRDWTPVKEFRPVIAGSVSPRWKLSLAHRALIRWQYMQGSRSN